MIDVAERNQRVLVIDDLESIHQDFRAILGRKNDDPELDSLGADFLGESPPSRKQTSFEVDSAFQGQEGLAKVKCAIAEERPYALAFVDIRMPPGWDGVETLRRIWDVDAELQAVLCSAYSDYSYGALTTELQQTGRLLILKKPFDPIVVRQLAANLSENWNRAREEQRLLAELKASESKYRSAIEAAPFGLLVQDASGSVIDCNAAACHLFGGAKEQIMGGLLKAYFKPELTLPLPSSSDGSAAFRTTCARLDGSTFQADVTSGVATICGLPLSMVYVHEIAQPKSG